MRKPLVLVAVFFVVFANPARAQFCPGAAPWVFDDVPAGDLFCGYITWAAQNGITLGCAIIDANHRLYCPNEAVTRSQMAAFVNRLGNVRVEAVGTGPGLTGGPITGIGTINLATTQLLPTTACANNQIARWNGSAWVCSTDANSGGTVTSVGSGTGLTGGPITATGALSIATGYQLPQGCTNGQVAKSNGSGSWTCASDSNTGGTVTSITAGNGLTGGTITTSGTMAVDPASTTLTGNFFAQGGNAFGATGILGTTDNNAIDVRANGARVMRYEPNALSPNVIGGSPANNVTAGARGATIGGGGTGVLDPDFGAAIPNRVTDAYGTVGGGYGNRAGDNTGTATDQPFATVGGGYSNTASGNSATVGGGYANNAIGNSASVGGGFINSVTGDFASVGGGFFNAASGSSASVGGGFANSANGSYGAVPGGAHNDAGANYSFAAGYRAKANYTGAFLWADSTDLDFKVQADEFTGSGPGWTNAANTFNVRATGGVWFVTAVNGVTGRPTAGLFVASGSGTWNSTSDRATKAGFARVDAQEVLARVASLPIGTWSYRTQDPSIRHMGPVAQDFRAAFGLGENDTTIATVDADGVALAAIQGLNAKVEAQAREIAELRRALEVLMARVAPEGRIASR